MDSIAKMFGGSRFEHEFKVGDKHTMVLQSLWKSEEVDVLRKVQGLDFYGQMEASKIPTIARSLVRFDGVPVQAYPDFQDEFKKCKNKDEKINTVEVMEKVISEMDGGFIDFLYEKYIELKGLREKERATLLGFTQGPQEGPSTGSASSTEKLPEK